MRPFPHGFLLWKTSLPIEIATAYAMSEKHKQAKKEIEVVYHLASADPEESERRVNAAFNVLFELVDRKLSIKKDEHGDTNK